MTRIHSIFPAELPEAWASDWGEDDYGIFMGFTYKGVRQDFRWIEPCTFLMGSPKNEPQRDEDEVQHEVTLTNGFWLADTTVTQALWEAVMGENPSRIKQASYPVESINWDSSRFFISKLNNLKEDLQLCIPTEAQWEYACRAGETTAFSFGKKITQQQVNFGGNQPSHNPGKRKIANHGLQKELVDVKSFEPNAWGLFNMHGNVWEWCHDWYEEYPRQLVVNPSGAFSGNRRILRGGSWIDDATSCRSAYRGRSEPDDRFMGYYGFRLARSL